MFSFFLLYFVQYVFSSPEAALQHLQRPWLCSSISNQSPRPARSFLTFTFLLCIFHFRFFFASCTLLLNFHLFTFYFYFSLFFCALHSPSLLSLSHSLFTLYLSLSLFLLHPAHFHLLHFIFFLFHFLIATCTCVNANT